MSGLFASSQRVLLFDLAAAVTHAAPDAATVRARIPIPPGLLADGRALLIEAGLSRAVSGTTATLNVRATAPGGNATSGVRIAQLAATGTAKAARGAVVGMCRDAGASLAMGQDTGTSISGMTATGEASTLTAASAGVTSFIAAPWDLIFVTVDSGGVAFDLKLASVELRRLALQAA